MNWHLPTILLIGSILVGCNAGDNKTNIELAPNMFDQISLKAQDWDPNKDGKGSQLVPPENTVPRGKHYPKHMDDMFQAQEKLKNPYAKDMSPETMSLGKARYEVYCGLCHADSGDGSGLVGTKMVIKPRDLLADPAKKYTDGRIYWAIVKGFGIMGGYANQLHTEKERWAVVNYVRSLQKQAK